MAAILQLLHSTFAFAAVVGFKRVEDLNSQFTC